MIPIEWLIQDDVKNYIQWNLSEQTLRIKNNRNLQIIRIKIWFQQASPIHCHFLPLKRGIPVISDLKVSGLL